MGVLLTYTLTCVSDAQPGTGLAQDAANDLVPRNFEGQINIPATHIKGLLRDVLSNLDKDLFNKSLKAMGESDIKDLSRDCSLSFTDANIIGKNIETFFITRTKIDDNTGNIEAGSLRTSETIKKGTQFKGNVYVQGSGDINSIIDAIKLGLMSIEAFGSNRNRGMGLCSIDIENCNQSPAQIYNNIKGAV